MRRRVERQGLGKLALAISFLPKESPDLLKQGGGWDSEYTGGEAQSSEASEPRSHETGITQY